MNVEGIFISSDGPVSLEIAPCELARKIRVVMTDPEGSIGIYMTTENSEAAKLACAAFDGELARALRAYVSDYDETQSDTEGRWPLPDTGCIDCTCGTVTNTQATGRCLYHLARRLLK